jgi:hypothetical protein
MKMLHKEEGKRRGEQWRIRVRNRARLRRERKESVGGFYLLINHFLFDFPMSVGLYINH